MNENQERQQSTLSVRVPQSLRNYLQRARGALANGHGERLSLSDVAKVLLEEAQHSPLDERLLVSSLLLDPTGTLLAIRAKWERQAVVSPAEWMVLARYVEVACEGTAEDPALPKGESFLDLLKALRALLKLRAKQPSSRDPYYLNKLLPSRVKHDGDDARAITAAALVDNLIEELSEPGSHAVPVYAGRALHVALRDEEYPSVLALHEALAPFLPTVFRLAARGHWLEERRPLRPPDAPVWRGEDPYRHPAFPPALAYGGEFQLTTLATQDGDLEMALHMKSRDALFSLGPIRRSANSSPSWIDCPRPAIGEALDSTAIPTPAIVEPVSLGCTFAVMELPLAFHSRSGMRSRRSSAWPLSRRG